MVKFYNGEIYVIPQEFEDEVRADERAKDLDEFDRICEEARSHNFGVCPSDFLIDVIKAKVKEQLKETK